MLVYEHPRLGEPARAPAASRADVVLQSFAFNKSTLIPAHGPLVASLADRIVRSQSSPPSVRAVRIVGHTDAVGSETSNAALGLRRARAAGDALRAAIDARRPGLSRSLLWRIESRGELDPIPGNPAASRRTEFFLTAASPPPPPPAPAPTPAAPCPPATCTPPAAFRPSVHGFRFVNSFTLAALSGSSSIPPAARPILARLLAGSFGLCGGMASAAKDHFLTCVPRPSATTPPSTGPLFAYLLMRQIESLALPSLALVNLFLAWSMMPDTSTTLPLSPVSIPGTQELTLPQLRATLTRLSRSDLTVLGLVYVGPRSAAIWENHQVLAYAHASPAPGVTDLKVYDPNFPMRDDVVIRARVVGTRVQCEQLLAGSPHKKVRGFFIMPYTRRVPLCLP
jgi:hypothetical protein